MRYWLALLALGLASTGAAAQDARQPFAPQTSEATAAVTKSASAFDNYSSLRRYCYFRNGRRICIYR